MSNVFCVRAEFGTYTNPFIEGGYAAIGWFQNVDLSGVTTREELYDMYKQAHPKDTSNLVIGQQVGQIARFLFDIQPGDYVITPAADTEWLHYGRVAAGWPGLIRIGGSTTSTVRLELSSIRLIDKKTGGRGWSASRSPGAVPPRIKGSFPAFEHVCQRFAESGSHSPSILQPVPGDWIRHPVVQRRIFIPARARPRPVARLFRQTAPDRV